MDYQGSENTVAVQVKTLSRYTPSATDDTVSSECSGSCAVAIAGEVREVCATSPGFGNGMEVVGYSTAPDGISKSQHIEYIDARKVYQKPKNISFQDATDMALAYVTASATLQRQLGISLPLPHADATGTGQYAEKRILITGGQTALAAAMTQVLHMMEPDCHILVTSSMHDQYQLLQRCVHLSMLGAEYTIDEEAPDLLEHLTNYLGDDKGVDVVIESGGDVVQRAGILTLLNERRKLVDCRVEDVGARVSTLLAERPDIIPRFQALLVKAADTFEVVTEPQCQLSDD